VRPARTGAADMAWGAIVLAGGRGSRLGGADKAGLVDVEGRTTLARVVDACDGARPIVVVGPAGEDPRVIWTREQPEFSGPGRAVAAGMAAIGDVDWVVVLACDMPRVEAVVPALLTAARTAGMDVEGVVAEAAGRNQWLCAAFRTAPLRAACAVDVASMAGLVSGLRLVRLPVDEHLVADIDTPDDLAASGYTSPGS